MGRIFFFLTTETCNNEDLIKIIFPFLLSGKCLTNVIYIAPLICVTFVPYASFYRALDTK